MGETVGDTRGAVGEEGRVLLWKVEFSGGGRVAGLGRVCCLARGADSAGIVGEAADFNESDDAWTVERDAEQDEREEEARR